MTIKNAFPEVQRNEPVVYCIPVDLVCVERDRVAKMDRTVCEIEANYIKSSYLPAANDAAPGGSVPYVKGMYRCDTFVLDVYVSNGAVTADGSSQSFTAQQKNWFQFEAGPLKTPLLPAAVFSKLKAYAG